MFARGMRAGLGALLLLGLVTAHRADVAAADNPGVYPLSEKVGGKSYAEWTAAWWQWALSPPKGENPIVDNAGKFSERGQSGPVWFLAGNFGGKVTRKCSVPAGKVIFFPVLNQLGHDRSDTAEEKDLRAFATTVADSARDLEVIADGKALKDVKKYRVASALFTVQGPAKAEDEVFPGIAGKHKAVSDGYWIMLKPLAPGEHVIRFKGRFTAVPLELDVTYKLTVVKAKAP
jgi:hypothetical protein